MALPPVPYLPSAVSSCDHHPLCHSTCLWHCYCHVPSTIPITSHLWCWQELSSTATNINAHCCRHCPCQHLRSPLSALSSDSFLFHYIVTYSPLSTLRTSPTIPPTQSLLPPSSPPTKLPPTTVTRKPWHHHTALTLLASTSTHCLLSLPHPQAVGLGLVSGCLPLLLGSEQLPFVWSWLLKVKVIFS